LAKFEGAKMAGLDREKEILGVNFAWGVNFPGGI